MIQRRRFTLTLLLTALILLPIAAISTPAGSSLAKGDHVFTRPYVLATLSNMTFNRIDPDTLADMPGEVWLGFSTRSPEILVSGDGRTIDVVYYWKGSNAGSVLHRKDVTIHVFDARNGAQLTAFHPRVAMGIRGISFDGSELYGYGATNADQSWPWYAINGQTGRVEARLLLSNSYDPLVDHTTNRLYAFHSFPFDQKTDRPQSPVLTSYDIHGQLERAVRLDGVMAGWDNFAKDENGAPVMEMWNPGVALSPDGSQLAILDGASDTLRIIDMHSMNVVRTETLSQPQSPLSLVAGLLGILPTTAEAKEIEGVSLSMQYSPDGKSLYVTGMRGSLNANGRYSMHGLGLRRIDVQTGTVESTAFQGQMLWWSQLAPDGSAYYTLTPAAKDSQGNDACPCTLDRLDPQTLAVTAKRTYQLDPATDSLPNFYILASPVS